MQTEGSLSLFEVVQRNANCQYLSDLHNLRQAEQVLAAIRALPVEQFPEEEWQELAAYIQGGARPEMPAAEIREALCAFLQRTADARRKDQKQL